MKKQREINIAGLDGISLGPLYELEDLRKIMAWNTQISEADRERFADIL